MAQQAAHGGPLGELPAVVLPGRGAPHVGVQGLAGGALDGPWVSAMWFAVPTRVRSKSNARRGKRGSQAAAAWRDNLDFENDVTALARVFCPAGWALGPPPPAPVAARPVVVAFIYARTLLDTANLAKSIPDAVQGVLYWSDSSLRTVLCDSQRTGQQQEGLVAFAQLDPRAGVAERHAAVAALAAAVTALPEFAALDRA